MDCFLWKIVICKNMKKIVDKNARDVFGADESVSEFTYNINSDKISVRYSLKEILIRRTNPDAFFKTQSLEATILKKTIRFGTSNGKSKEIPVEERREDINQLLEQCRLEIEKELILSKLWEKIEILPNVGNEVLKDIREKY